ncbi:ABC transporter permease [Janibacter sp. YB324]|uniref:ABC transporter permease n=1 Tax=Janibacter sp. YB324 TaxID=2761047 RepID=UPI001626BD5C|nr:FtsX-like permease family protein [Janibacter sp. YB324]QNF95604.1 FtsX-like permease family protein [Janibacter sp. YB324]
MSDVLQLTLASLRHQSRRFLAPGLAVVLGVAFIAATLVLTGTLQSSMRTSVAGHYAPYASVVTPKGDDADSPSLPAGIVDEVSEVDGVTSVDAVRESWTMASTPAGQRGAFVTTGTSTHAPGVVEGRAARASDEVTLSTATASSFGSRVGDEVTFASGDDGSPVRAEVVGIVDVADHPVYGSGTPVVFTTAAGVTDLTGLTGWTEIDVRGGDEAATTRALRDALPLDADVASTTEASDDLVSRVTGGTDVLGVLLTAFAAIALFVSAIVIGNTFGILLARRARETALLRAVGSTRGQVVRSALVEALVVGLVFSAVGVLAGIGLASALVAAGNAWASNYFPTLVLDVPAKAVLLPVLAGVVVVVCAALRPVLRSSRVAPLAALRPDAAITARSRAGRLRVASGVVLIVLGGGALAAAAASHQVLPGVLGGFLSFAGVLLVGSVLVPWLVRLVGSVAARPFGPAGRLAVDNAVRNPARAAGTTAALLVGVTLVSMTAVGAATAKSALTEVIDAQYAVDVVVQGDDVTDAQTSRLAGVEGVAGDAAVETTTVRVTGAGERRDVQVAALPPGIDDVVRDPSAVTHPATDEVVLSEEQALEAGIASGDEVTVSGPRGRAELTVAVGQGMGAGWLVDPTVLRELDDSPTTGAVFLRLADDADVDRTVEGVQQVATQIEGSEVGGGAQVRQTHTETLDLALAIVLALLAISVVIAVVGIANTLSLSVIERTRESALLRALGLTRGQLRRMLAVEAVLLAVVGTLLGAVLGAGYAWVGVTALLGEFTDAPLVLPWSQLLAVGAGAVIAGLLASVLPARRAARVAPAAALAAD